MPHAIVAAQPGGSSVLEFVEVARPVPGPGQVLIRTAAIGINFVDVYQREGRYPIDFPFVPGKEAVGEVVEVASDVTTVSVGDRVASNEVIGGYAEFALIPAEGCLPVPAGLSDEVAAALPLQGMTAHYLVNTTFVLEPGHTCIVHSAAGGVGLLLTQMAKAKGATVIATVSTPEKEELARGAGADYVVGYADFAERAREITGGVGVDVVYDGVGQATFDDSLASLRVRGSLVSYGSSSGQVPPFDLGRLMRGGSLTLVRPSLWNYTQLPGEREWRSREVFGAAASGELSVRIGAIFPLGDAKAAHDALESRATTGKVVLLP